MSRRNLCIAVVDNDDGVRRAIARLLGSAGMDAVAFASGRAFLEATVPERFDCLVLDLHMPDMTGFELHGKLVSQGLRVPVVIVTGHDTPEYRASAAAAGVAAYLPKPVEARVLLGAITKAVEQHQDAIGGDRDREHPLRR
jgi:FixJ family two-component response regulator